MLKSIALQVTGDQQLACERCERRVQRLLGALRGVRNVQARARDQRIDVVFEATLVDAGAIVERLAGDGYQTVLATGTSARGGLRGAPAEMASATNVARANRPGWLGSVTSVLASAAGLICPACLPALAGLLASLGIGVAATEAFMRPVLIGLLVLAVAMFAWSARRHRRWWIVGAGIGGSVLVYLGRYYFGFPTLWMNQIALWAGAGVLVGTSVINLRLKRGCSACARESDSLAAATENCADESAAPAGRGVLRLDRTEPSAIGPLNPVTRHPPENPR